jgi:BMFP domain-containing protein YqiC
MEKGEVDIIMEENIGTFFPYYAKRQKAELFDMLMRRQNFDMTVVSAIPIFGYTQQAKDTELEHEGTMQLLQTIIWNHPSIHAIEPTASSATLGKYILLVDREFKEDVEDFVDSIFAKMPELDDQPGSFKKPQRGGNAFKKNRIDNISNYLKTLEESVAVDQMLTDDDSEYSATPPMRRRRPTISYAQATKRLSFNSETILGQPKEANANANATAMTTMSTLTQNSLDEALQKIRNETARSISELREEMKSDVRNIEQSIAATVIAAIQSKENPINMEVDSNTDGGSTGAASHDTTATMKTVMDKFESLTQIVIQLAEKVKLLADNQETMANKRSRPQAQQHSETQSNENTSNESRSPPAKQPRPPSTPPSTPPPYGHPEHKGAREEK